MKNLVWQFDANALENCYISNGAYLQYKAYKEGEFSHAELRINDKYYGLYSRLEDCQKAAEDIENTITKLKPKY